MLSPLTVLLLVTALCTAILQLEIATTCFLAAAFGSVLLDSSR